MTSRGLQGGGQNVRALAKTRNASTRGKTDYWLMFLWTTSFIHCEWTKKRTKASLVPDCLKVFSRDHHYQLNVIGINVIRWRIWKTIPETVCLGKTFEHLGIWGTPCRGRCDYESRRSIEDMSRGVLGQSGDQSSSWDCPGQWAGVITGFQDFNKGRSKGN